MFPLSSESFPGSVNILFIMLSGGGESFEESRIDVLLSSLSLLFIFR